MRLFCYDRIDCVPEGVEIADAAGILPVERITRYKNGSVALFANHFRYALQRHDPGIWVDTDHYCLKPLDFPDSHLFGRQANGHIANGVLRLPPDSPVVTSLLDLFDGRSIPVWAGTKLQRRARVLLEERGRIPWGELRWGLTGPEALTHYLTIEGLDGLAKPPCVFYPTDFTEAAWIVDPSRSLAEFVGADTVAVHLWNEKIKSFKNDPAPAGSFLARVQAEGA